MAMRFKAGDKAFIVESNRWIREVEIRSTAGGMYLIKFLDSGGAIKVKESRLFATREDAEKSLPGYKPEPKKRNQYDYMG